MVSINLKQLQSRSPHSFFLSMACQALTKSLTQCRGWPLKGGNYCHHHKDYTPELSRERWFQRYILAGGAPPFHFVFSSAAQREAICEPIRKGRIRLTKKDLLAIPATSAYIDVYLLLLSLSGLPPLSNVALANLCGVYYLKAMWLRPERTPVVCREIERLLLAPTGNMFFKYLMGIPLALSKVPRDNRMYDVMLEIVPPLLDSQGAKELSWHSKESLDAIRIRYEEHLGADHPITKALVEQWLPGLKKLYAQQKEIQKKRTDQFKEELMMNRWHPNRLWTYLNMGLDTDDM